MNNLKILINKLSKNNRMALEKAANTCISKMNYEIEIEHFFIELLQLEKIDLTILCKKFKVSSQTLMQDLEQEVDKLSKGNQQTPIFSTALSKLLEHAWLLASIDSGSDIIRSGHLLIALLTVPELHQMALRSSLLFDRFPVDSIKHKLNEYCVNSDESDIHQPLNIHQDNSQLTLHESDVDAENIAASSSMPSHKKPTPALDQFTINLTDKARSGDIDPVIGRETEIRQMMDILMRRRQNNPILTGEAGVGKTAVVEGLALKISQNQVPEVLSKVEIHALDMGLLQAGASVKGEFENRLKSVIKEVNESAHAIILFIDEAHTMIGAGGQAGQNDAANLLKPALARGQLRTIAATTWSEYKQFFEKDAALSRRFQVIKVEEPSVEVAVEMLRAMVPVMTQHFNIDIDDSAIFTAVSASHRYITGRQLPDKAVSVLDTASARVALSQTAKPALLDVLNAKQHNLSLELKLLMTEQQNLQHNDLSRIESVKQQLNELNDQVTRITKDWQTQHELVQQIKQLQLSVTSANDQLTQGQIDDTLNAIRLKRDELKNIQGATPLVFERVDEHMVGQIIADWTGIPIGKMLNDEIAAVLGLEDKLACRVMGQPYALHSLVQGVKTARAQLEDPNKPQGVFLFIGPSGVGKTETALALADELYGGERHLITINMSEYQEAHTVSTLKGAPPGYVGYGQGGILTEAVRRNPYSVILLDEIEKAHQDVQELFYQVFDKGSLEDGEGRQIDFKNCLIILTSNVGSSLIMQQCINQPVENWPTTTQLIDLLQPSLHKSFKPAFLGRMRIVPYYPLHDDLLAQIIEHKLSKISQRIAAQHGTCLSFSPELIELILSRCTEVDSGARNIDNILSGSVLPDLATHILRAMIDGKAPEKITIDVDTNQDITYSLHFAKKSKPKSKAKKVPIHSAKDVA